MIGDWVIGWRLGDWVMSADRRDGMYNCLVKPTLEDGLGALREATELAKSIRIDLDTEYLRAIATVEGLPQNQSGSDKTGVWKMEEAFRNHYRRVRRP